MTNIIKSITTQLQTPEPFKYRLPVYKKTVLDPSLIQAKLNKELSFAKDQAVQAPRFSLISHPSIKYTPFDKVSLEIDPLDEDGNERFQVGPYTALAYSCTGKRDSMEDAHIAQLLTLPDLNLEIPLFGVFDGHGGTEASQFLKEKLPAYLGHFLKKFSQNGQLNDPAIWNALKHAFIELDHDFKERTGSTATISLLIDNHIWTANLGDTRAILSTPESAIQLTEDASPENPRYAHSIKKRKGYILFNRINGRLACGRAFGDHDIGSPVNAVPHAPKITKHPILPNSTLLIACDGIWDVASTQEVSQYIQQDPNPQHVVDKAYKAGSLDNMTVLLVSL